MSTNQCQHTDFDEAMDGSRKCKGCGLATCSIDDIRINETQYHSYPVDEDGNRIDLFDDNHMDELDSLPYSCAEHGLDFETWDEVKEHLAKQEGDAKTDTQRSMESLARMAKRVGVSAAGIKPIKQGTK